MLCVPTLTSDETTQSSQAPDVGRRNNTKNKVAPQNAPNRHERDEQTPAPETVFGCRRSTLYCCTLLAPADDATHQQPDKLSRGDIKGIHPKGAAQPHSIVLQHKAPKPPAAAGRGDTSSSAALLLILSSQESRRRSKANRLRQRDGDRVYQRVKLW